MFSLSPKVSCAAIWSKISDNNNSQAAGSLYWRYLAGRHSNSSPANYGLALPSQLSTLLYQRNPYSLFHRYGCHVHTNISYSEVNQILQFWKQQSCSECETPREKGSEDSFRGPRGVCSLLDPCLGIREHRFHLRL